MNNKQGFTLIEILTAIIIIGVLVAAAYPQYRKVVQKSYATQAITLLRSMMDSSERLAMQKGYKSYSALRAADSDSTMSTLALMDMFDSASAPAGCTGSVYTLTCANGSDALKAFSYKVDAKGTDNKYYVAAKKLQTPYTNTYILLSRDDNQLYCQSVSESDKSACETFGLNYKGAGISC